MFAKKVSTTEITVRKVIVCRVAIFLREVIRQKYFLGIYEIFNMTNSSILDYEM